MNISRRLLMDNGHRRLAPEEGSVAAESVGEVGGDLVTEGFVSEDEGFELNQSW